MTSRYPSVRKLTRKIRSLLRIIVKFAFLFTLCLAAYYIFVLEPLGYTAPSDLKHSEHTAPPSQPSSPPPHQCIPHSLSEVSSRQWKHFIRSHLLDTSKDHRDVDDLRVLMDAAGFDQNEIVRSKVVHRIGKGYIHRTNISINEKTNGLDFLIQEKYKGRLSEGGSQFRGEIKGDNLIQVINFLDNFNGTYRACAPMPMECVQIQIELWFTNFSSFGMAKRVRKNILKREFCPDDSDKELRAFMKRLEVRKNSLECNETDFSLPDMAFQFVAIKDSRPMNRSRKWTAVSRDACMLRPFTPQDIRDCFARIPHVTILGDSHLRYSLTYLVEVLGQALPLYRKEKMESYKNHQFTFHFTLFANQIAEKLIQYSSESEQTHVGPGKIFILNTGWWPNHHHGIQNITQEFEKIFSAIKIFKSSRFSSETRMIWHGTVSYADDEKWLYKPPVKGHMNNYRQSAHNLWVYERLKPLGVEYVDNMQYGHPLHHDNVCKSHWVCPNEKQNGKVYMLDAGWNMVDAFHRKICEF